MMIKRFFFDCLASTVANSLINEKHNESGEKIFQSG